MKINLEPLTKGATDYHQMSDLWYKLVDGVFFLWSWAWSDWVESENQDINELYLTKTEVLWPTS